MQVVILTTTEYTKQTNFQKTLPVGNSRVTDSFYHAIIFAYY